MSRSPSRISYPDLVSGIGSLLELSRGAVARVVNSAMTATYWEIGRRIVEFEQQGKKRAKYGEALLKNLAVDLTGHFGRGFSERNLEQMRRFYELWPISQTASANFDDMPISQTLSAKSSNIRKGTDRHEFLIVDRDHFDTISKAFPLPWSHYVRLLTVKEPEARTFYEQESLRGGWSVRQLDRQISTLFYERALMSRNKTAMLKKGGKKRPEEQPSSDEIVRDPLVLEFLNLKDEYSESSLEDALIHHLESFLMELGSDFTFVGRQRRLRIGDEWYRVDLLFFQRRLRCLVIIDLKLGKFTHADAGQMLLDLNYAREHWTHADENPPVGFILCSSADSALVRYTLDALPSKVMAREYKLALPDTKRLEEELSKTRKRLEQHCD